MRYTNSEDIVASLNKELFNLNSQDANYITSEVINKRNEIISEKMNLISEGYSETEAIREIFTDRLENRFIPHKFLYSLVGDAVNYYLDNSNFKPRLDYVNLNNEIGKKLFKIEDGGYGFVEELSTFLFEKTEKSIILESKNGNLSELEVLVNEFSDKSKVTISIENLKLIYSECFDDSNDLKVNFPKFGYDKLFLFTKSKKYFFDSLTRNDDYSEFRNFPIIRSFNKLKGKSEDNSIDSLITRMKSGGRAADKILNKGSYHDIFGVKLLVNDISYLGHYSPFNIDLNNEKIMKSKIIETLSETIESINYYRKEEKGYLRNCLNIYKNESDRLPIPSFDSNDSLFKASSSQFPLILGAYKVMNFLDFSENYSYSVQNRLFHNGCPSIRFKIDNLVTDEPLELLVELNTKDDKIPHDNYVMRRDYVIKYLKKFVPELNSLGNFLNEYLYSSLDSVDLQRKLN